MLGSLPVNAEAGGSYPVISLEKSPPATAAWEVNSSRDSVLWSSDTLSPGVPLPLRPHEGLRSKDMRRISAQDLSTPDSPSFQLYSSLISFR